MRHSHAEKVATYERIVEVAARLFRERGLHDVSIADVMEGAGLTVGGFYKHFDSRSALVTAALKRALRDIEWLEAAIPVAPEKALQTYISKTHRDGLDAGCPISALVNDMSRGEDATRQAYSDKVEDIITLLAKASHAKHADKRRARAFLVLSASVGAVTLSRAVLDPTLSQEILTGTLAMVLETLTAA